MSHVSTDRSYKLMDANHFVTNLSVVRRDAPDAC
jgi:hypothetical protein